MVALLGGAFSPIGWSVGWVELPMPGVLQALLAWRRGLGADLEVQALGRSWPQSLHNLEPLEAPWTSELLIAHGDSWTCYPVDDEASYAEAALVRRRVGWKTRKQTLAEARASWMLDE